MNVKESSLANPFTRYLTQPLASSLVFLSLFSIP